MVNINWAKDNCSKNLIKEKEIAEAKEWLEIKIDYQITEACLRGRHNCSFVPEYFNGRPDNIQLHEEAIKEVVENYEKNGYKVNKYERGENFASYQLIW